METEFIEHKSIQSSIKITSMQNKEISQTAPMKMSGRDEITN